MQYVRKQNMQYAIYEEASATENISFDEVHSAPTLKRWKKPSHIFLTLYSGESSYNLYMKNLNLNINLNHNLNSYISLRWYSVPHPIPPIRPIAVTVLYLLLSFTVTVLLFAVKNTYIERHCAWE